MNYLAYFILGASLLGLLLLAVPISLGYDSAAQRFQVRWLGLTFTKKPAARPQPDPRPTTPKSRRKTGLVVMARLWQKRDLVSELLHKFAHFLLKVIKTLSFQDSEAAISLPDPMWNGVLYGLLANVHLEELNLSVNFEQRNYAKIWVTVYPHRLARHLAALLICLPYLQILRFAWGLRHPAERS